MNAGNKNTPSMHHPRRRNLTTSVVGLRNGNIPKISPQVVNPRDIAGKRRRTRALVLPAVGGPVEAEWQMKGVDQFEDQNAIGEITLWCKQGEVWTRVAKDREKLEDSDGGLLPAVEGHSLE